MPREDLDHLPVPPLPQSRGRYASRVSADLLCNGRGSARVGRVISIWYAMSPWMPPFFSHHTSDPMDTLDHRRSFPMLRLPPKPPTPPGRLPASLLLRQGPAREPWTYIPLPQIRRSCLAATPGQPYLGCPGARFTGSVRRSSASCATQSLLVGSRGSLASAAVCLRVIVFSSLVD